MRRPLVVGIVAGAVGLVVLDAIAARLGITASLVPHADGPWAWIASRAAGLTAFVALALDVLFGLFLSTGAADRWVARARSVEIHRWLGSVALALVGGHALLLAADGFVRFDVLDALVPFVAPFRPLAVAVGVVAAYVTLVVHASFALRSRLGQRTWRRLHGLSFVGFALALAHGLVAGSDTGVAGVRLLYVVTVGLVVVLGGVRLVGHLRRAAG